MTVRLEYTIGQDIPSELDLAVAPLAGNGFTAPSSCYDVAATIPGDASGGRIELQLTPDPQFCCLVSHICVRAGGVVRGLAVCFLWVRGVRESRLPG